MPPIDLAATETEALTLDARDPLAGMRDEFLIPRHTDGSEQAYFCGNSLGLQPRATREALADELDDWQRLAVEAHFRGKHPWMPYHELVREDLAAVVGAKPHEVVAMNSLTVNLHLMMVSFYRPTAQRHAILIERGAFPSDHHAVASQIRFHGFDPADALIQIDGDANGVIAEDTILRALDEHGERIALVLLPGVQYLSGQAFDLAAITRAAHAKGCKVGFDLAHAAGNLDLRLHDSGCDFAAWCSYKYLNAGPGAIAGCFVHERHARADDLPRFAGWWGHDPATRFLMRPQFLPAFGADGWQLSNPPIFALAPLRVSLAQFRRVGMAALRAKSVALTAYFERLIHAHVADVLDVLTPADPAQRGCQLSLRVKGAREAGRSLYDHLHARGIVVDWREPDVIRAAPTPLYNRHIDCLRFVRAVRDWAAAR
jgi:kynureninase